MKKVYCILFLCGLFLPQLSAKHIIGGEITYVCNGGNGYTFTMEVYRDCNSDGAPFDEPAFFTIYSEVNGLFTRIESLSTNLVSSETVPLPDDPCTQVPDVCVQKGLYRFSRNLPLTGGTYHIIYQRCCRNNTIANLVDPGSQGATYTVTIPPLVQNIVANGGCNSSPTFDNFPPIVICAGASIDFDHGTTDTDGDQLIYRFCSPERGGGLVGSPGFDGDPAGCDGVQPNPACPPPHGNVLFAFPTYEATNPMGGDPQVVIDPNTGFISGVPNILGQFVVGVCVDEYRNGELLSTIKRDFQFNVTTCQPLVEAAIASDDVVNGNQFILTSCGDDVVNFENLSEQRSNIENFFWEFDANKDGQTERYTEWEPSISFSDTGQYIGMLVLNPGLICADTAEIILGIYPEIYPDFSFTYDTCLAGPVVFTDLSFSDAGPNTITDWEWDFGDGNTSLEQNPMHTYLIPGVFPVALTVTDINGCRKTIVKDVTYYPAPETIIVEPNTFIGCEPADIFFNNLSIPVDSTYDILWTFGDGGTSTEVSPTHVYIEPGVYSIKIEMTSPIGCFAADSFNNFVTILPSPDAAFDYNPQELNSFDPTANFIDQSTEPNIWDWTFGESGTSFEQNPSYTFPDTGLQTVVLVVTHESGCTDTAIQVLDIIPQVRYFLPNAFTPNYDDLNDEFVGVGIFDGMRNFQIQIWNRWGESVFASNDPNEGWNGRKNNTGKFSSNGVYVYRASYITPRNEQIELKGFATLIK